MIILTTTSVASENVKDEISYALDHNKEIVPILLENCSIPLRLCRVQYEDLRGRNFDSGLQAVKDRLRALAASAQHPLGHFVAALCLEPVMNFWDGKLWK